MSSSIKIFFYVALFVSTLCMGNGIHHSAPGTGGEDERQETARRMLSEKLLALNFERLANRDYNWLESLGANYDYDNQQYFLEFACDATSKDSTILLMVNFAAKESIEIRVFAPEELSYVWLRCRLRVTEERLYINYVFHPQSNNSKLFRQIIQRSHALAAVVSAHH